MKCRRTQWAVIVIVIIAITIYLIVARHKIDVYHYVRSLGFATVTSNYSDGEPTVMCAYPPPTSTNVIAILVPPNDFTDIAARLSQLDVRFVDNCSSSVMLFHTGFPFASEIAQIMSATRRRVIFRNVDREFASFPNGFDPYTNEPTFWKRGKWNYHHMIRFWFKLIFDIEEMKNFDYVMRLDTDSRLIGKWANVFDLMKIKDVVYIANDEQIEFEKVLPGTLELQTFFTDYTTKKKLIPQDPTKISAAFMKNGIRTYYNNFELFKTTFFRQAIVQDWINAIDASHGIYKYRWGDAILRYLTLALFAKDHQVIHRNQLNLPYCHPC